MTIERKCVSAQKLATQSIPAIFCIVVSVCHALTEGVVWLTSNQKAMCYQLKTWLNFDL